MKRSLHLWSQAGIVAVAAMAVVATAALAYEQPNTEARSALLIADQDADPGIDFMITGPAGPSKRPLVRTEMSTSKSADLDGRRRMHLD